MPDKSWAKFWLAWRGAILLFGFLFASAAALWWAVDTPSQPNGGDGTMKKLAVVIGFSFVFYAMGLVVTFFWIFRGVNADEGRLDAIINYCYAFIIFALSASILPFFVLPNVEGLRNAMILSPVGILTGCSVQSTSGHEFESDVPRELACNSMTDQWVVNIGGIAGCPLGDHRPVPQCPGAVQPIQGGLIVPLYVIVLALMGAAVSMTRRVPEYQRRMSPGDPEFLSWDQAREGLVFQIMQVASAPMIAITIYYIVDPGSRATTIVLGFASGFSSETVLLVIRAMLEKIKPIAPNAGLKPVLVEVMPGRLEFGSIGVDKASKKTVGVINNGAADLVLTSISCSGEFTVSMQAPIKLPAGSGVSLEVQFNPRTPGVKTGVLVLTDNAQRSPRPVDLVGTGIKE